MKKKLKNILFILMLLGGVGILLYPDIASWYNARNQAGVVQRFHENVAGISQEEIDEHFRRAREYNDLLTGIAITDPFVVGSGAVIPAPDYLEILYVDGVMGQIEIPAIGVLLPIFHTTDYEVLNRGVGHIEGTSFPVGGRGSHAVLTGHSGLPHARMFTDLEEIVLGDVFFIRVLNYTMAYQIDDINTVLPYEIESLRVSQEADFVTLITCTPYGINSHRLLLRGIRIPYVPDMEDEIEYILANNTNWRWVILAIFAILFIIIFIIRMIRKRNDRLDPISDFKETVIQIIRDDES